MDSKVEVIDIALNSIKSKQNFIIRGGAGSGKTETLKILIKNIYQCMPEKKVICITHTNVAVAEIRSRTENLFEISTIHNFIYSLISNYNKNIKIILPEIFKIQTLEECKSEKECTVIDYEIYKKIYEKYRKKNFSINNSNSEKLIGKREYDSNPELYISKLNSCVDVINKKIVEIIDRDCDYKKIKYNQTKFDSFKNFSYGHDSLLKIFFFLVDKYPIFKKTINDKYDLILIDEFQDTNKLIIKSFIDHIVGDKTIIGLFGDDMQAIYQDGIGDVKKYIEEGQIKDIKKEDNFRCSEQIIDFLNTIRIDFKQQIALKNGESLEERQGKVYIYYVIDDNKPSLFSRDSESRITYLNNLDKSIGLIVELIKKEENNNIKILMLSNSAVAKKLKFENLYSIFSDKYIEVKDEIENMCENLGWFDVIKMYKNYVNKNHSYLIDDLRKNGYIIKSLSDKKNICNVFGQINDNNTISELINLLTRNEMYIESEKRINQINYMNEMVKNSKKNEELKNFINNFNSYNTAKRMHDAGIEITQETFDSLSNLMKDLEFYDKILDGSLEISELLNYYEYLNDNSEYLTMHKTKGTSIDNVLIVLDEFFWGQMYNFDKLFEEDDTSVCQNTKKLFYVACSRARKNLYIYKVIKKDEENKFKSFFGKCKNCIIINKS